jgi:hypothetical protein
VPTRYERGRTGLPHTPTVWPKVCATSSGYDPAPVPYNRGLSRSSEHESVPQSTKVIKPY